MPNNETTSDSETGYKSDDWVLNCILGYVIIEDARGY